MICQNLKTNTSIETNICANKYFTNTKDLKLQEAANKMYKQQYFIKTSLALSSPVSIIKHLVTCALIACVWLSYYLDTLHAQQQVAGGKSSSSSSSSYPGVSRDLASFCSSRPSLSIDLALMIVHVKRNTSFNYKLYLISNDEHVFQTGQIVPRDDFRIHSFPVKLKRFVDFIPNNILTYKQIINDDAHNETHNLRHEQVPSSSFNLKQFFSMVPSYNEVEQTTNKWKVNNNQQVVARQEPNIDVSQLQRQRRRRRRQQQRRQTTGHNRPMGRRMPFDVYGDALPGDHNEESFVHHDVALIDSTNLNNNDDDDSQLNKHIQFDRDDQVAVLSPAPAFSRQQQQQQQHHATTLRHKRDLSTPHTGDVYASSSQSTMIMPVSSFSSFHVNLTYLVRKDFGQQAPELIRLRIDSSDFRATELLLISALSSSSNSIDNTNSSSPLISDHNVDYAFLSHKLLRDPNTRITSINQIYEDWITRNYYTIVYIQRRTTIANTDDDDDGPHVVSPTTSDRLVFRGSSSVLLGADQLAYTVKASAFITEKNGLHYYLEFLSTNKFYLGAIDWSKRPFKIIDSHHFPMRATQTQFDNEELLLCPPAVCYAAQPIDEIVAYGRLQLADKFQLEARILSRALFDTSNNNSSTADYHHHHHQNNLNSMERDESDDELVFETRTNINESRVVRTPSSTTSSSSTTTTTTTTSSPLEISLDALTDAMRAGAHQLDVRLHLRDWQWTLTRAISELSNETKFAFNFELARRNDIKLTPIDSYGFVLAGHQIDASYRVYNDLFLISSNQVLTINYTQANETVTSAHPLAEEFNGLTSTLLDPITGAFYDRYTNQIYFFKGDRYVGYDYASKKALDEFVLPPPSTSSSVESIANLMLMQQATSPTTRQLVSSLPVVGILGRQHHVDALFHDPRDDLVYVFSGMKFYTFQANEFKDGSFVESNSGGKLVGGGGGAMVPPMRCINEHFFDGCRFDAAYPNPCHNDKQQDVRANDLRDEREFATSGQNDVQNNFNEEQQLKLRSIAARGSLLDILLENTLVNKANLASASLEPFFGASLTQQLPSQQYNDSSIVWQTASAQERIVVYLLAAMVLLTIAVTFAMMFVILRWSSNKMSSLNGTNRQQFGDEHVDNVNKIQQQQQQQQNQLHDDDDDDHKLHQENQLRMKELPPAIARYLSNQYPQHVEHTYTSEHHHHHQQQQQQRDRRLSSGGSHRSRYSNPVSRLNQLTRHVQQPPLTQAQHFLTNQTNVPSQRKSMARHLPVDTIDSSAL